MGTWQVDGAWVLDRLVTSCCVLTAALDGVVGACLVGSVMPLGLTDGLVVFSLGKGSHTGRLVRPDGIVGINILSTESIDLARWFGRARVAGEPRLTGSNWQPGAIGAPVITAALGVAEARVISSTEVRDHVVYVAEVVHATVFDRRPAPFTVAEARACGLEPPRTALAGGTHG